MSNTYVIAELNCSYWPDEAKQTVESFFDRVDNIETEEDVNSLKADYPFLAEWITDNYKDDPTSLNLNAIADRDNTSFFWDSACAGHKGAELELFRLISKHYRIESACAAIYTVGIEAGVDSDRCEYYIFSDDTVLYELSLDIIKTLKESFVGLLNNANVDFATNENVREVVTDLLVKILKHTTVNREDVLKELNDAINAFVSRNKHTAKEFCNSLLERIAEPMQYEQSAANNEVDHEEATPKYDPCRLFKKGDKVRVKRFNGRTPRFENAMGMLDFDKVFVVEQDEEKPSYHNMINIGSDFLHGAIHVSHLELVTPVEELEPFFVGTEASLTERCIYLKTPDSVYLVAQFHEDIYSREYVQAECDRLNEQHRKELEA